jgi:opacity protein-like surface antigen
MKPSTIALATALIAVGASAPAVAADGIGFYVKPSVGYSWITLKTLEIETNFVRPPLDDEGDPIDDNADFDPDDARRSVGRRTYYTGGALTLGISGGLHLFDLWLGMSYSYMPSDLEGYSKRYRYEPEKVRATGKKFNDEGVAQFQRVMLELRYGLPIWRFEIDFQTRVGAIYIEDGPLIMGRAVDSEAGYTGDLGVGLAFAPFRYLKLGVSGWFGFFSFTGKYDGAYGTVGGIDLSIIFHI